MRAGWPNVAVGPNAMSLKGGIEGAVEAAVATLKDIAWETETKEQIGQVPSIFAADPEMGGGMISEVVDKVGTDAPLPSRSRRPSVWSELARHAGLMTVSRPVSGKQFRTSADLRLCLPQPPLVLRKSSGPAAGTGQQQLLGITKICVL